jgi:hypothetical protein
MSESVTAPAPRTAAAGPIATALGVGLVLALAVVVVGNTNVDAGENGGLWPGVVTGVLCVVLAAVLYWLVRDRWAGSARACLVLGILAVVALVAFWSGVPLVLAGSAWATAAGAGPGSRPLLVGKGLALLSAVLAIVVTVVGAF